MFIRNSCNLKLENEGTVDFQVYFHNVVVLLMHTSESCKTVAKKFSWYLLQYRTMEYSSTCEALMEFFLTTGYCILYVCF